MRPKRHFLSRWFSLGKNSLLLQTGSGVSAGASTIRAFQKEKTVTLPDHLAEEEPLFSGFVRYENTISCKKGEGLLLEISKAAEGVEVFVNGVSAGIQIAAPYRYDLQRSGERGRKRTSH